MTAERYDNITQTGRQHTRWFDSTASMKKAAVICEA